jgi:LmbE family N-acetylglucosaminyl deacetylase
MASVFKNIERVVVLAPHTDDGEFGCGGTIAKLTAECKEVYYVAFSACKQSVLPEFPEDILITEVHKATEILGVKKSNLILHDFPVRTFNSNRQDILQIMINLRNELKPDLVMMPSVNDLHQDHHTIAMEGLRAFKFSSIFCYEVPWNNITFNTSCFVHLDENNVDLKVTALKAYASQAHKSTGSNSGSSNRYSIC